MAARDDWFRNERWSPAIEAEFDKKLARTRSQGPQYICIQAGLLSKTEPRVSLRLLERYFATDDEFFRARAFETQAEAHEALLLFDKAVESYQNALRWEETHRCMITTSHLSLPFLIATQRLRIHFDIALDVLFSPYYRPLERGERRLNYILMFPISVFLHACALALIYRDLGEEQKAVEQASRALTASATGESPFPRHRGIGLVTNKYSPQIKLLHQIVGEV